MFGLTSSLAWADEVRDPCTSILALVNRPSAADSACVVPFEKGMLETGARYFNLKGGAHGYNLPEAELRLGLPVHTELTINFPNYNHQTQVPHSGLSPTVVGLKHELGYNARWLGAIEGLVTLSSGSTAFGSNATGGTINGIVNYSLNSQLSMLFMLGLSTQTLPSDQGGQRYNSVNPDAVLTWQFNDKWQAYGEIYGQSKTGPRNGVGFNTDAGLQWAFKTNWVTGLEVGQRISGKLGQFNHYVGAGLSVLF